jgi:preprotein translocase subunit SecG
MYIALVVVHVIVGFGIIGIVLLQAGKGAEIGSAFGGGGTQAVFGSMGTPTVLGKATAAIAVLFVLTSFGLTLLHGGRGRSVIREPQKPTAAPTTAPAPATPPAPAGSPAPAAQPAPAAK